MVNVYKENAVEARHRPDLPYPRVSEAQQLPIGDLTGLHATDRDEASGHAPF